MDSHGIGNQPWSLLELHEFHTLFNTLDFNHVTKFGFRFMFQSDGVYRVNILRRMLDAKINQSVGPQICWSKLIPLKVKCFIWRAVLDRIPVVETLIYRGINVQNQNCQLCGTCIETTNHLLVECAYSKDVWYWILRWCDIKYLQARKVEDIIIYAATCLSGEKEYPEYDIICYFMKHLDYKK